MRSLLVGLFIFAATPVFAVSALNKPETEAKLKTVNRSFQVYLERDLSQNETRQALLNSRDQLTQYLRASTEFRGVFEKRITRFLMGKYRNEQLAPSLQSVVQKLADPNVSLDTVLNRANNGRHRGKICHASSASICFARWLVRTAAGPLGVDWVTERQIAIQNMTYLQLVEEMAKSYEQL